MSRFPTEPIGHVTPRPPIEINPRKGITLEQRAWRPGDYEPLSAEECQRLWRLVKNAAEGSNVGDAPAPDPHDHYVADDWDAG